MATDTSIRVVQIVTSLERRRQVATPVAAAQGCDPTVSMTILAGPSLDNGDGWWGSASLDHVDLELVPDLVPYRSLLRDLAALRMLIVQLRRLKPDVVHTYGSKPGLLGGLAARLVGVSCVHSMSYQQVARLEPKGSAWRRKLAQLSLGARRRSVGLNERLVVSGRRDQQLLAELGIGDSGRYRLIRNGVSLPEPDEVAESRRRYRTEHGLVGRLVVGSSDCLAKTSDPRTVIEGFWLAALPGATLLVVGEGPRRSEAEALIAELTGRDPSLDIRLVGYRGDSAALMTACDIVVEVGDEGLSKPTLEAAAAGLCVVAPDRGSVADLVVDGQSGVVVEANNPAVVSRALSELAGDPDRRQRLGAELRQRCRPFAVDRMRGNLVDLWWEVASGTLRPEPPSVEPDPVSAPATAPEPATAGTRAARKARTQSVKR